MKLIQYCDMPEGGLWLESALITIGDIIQANTATTFYWRPKHLEQYVQIRIPLPWKKTEYRPASDRQVKGWAELFIFFATGIAPMGRWTILHHVRRVTHQHAPWRPGTVCCWEEVS